MLLKAVLVLMAHRTVHRTWHCCLKISHSLRSNWIARRMLSTKMSFAFRLRLQIRWQNAFQHERCSLNTIGALEEERQKEHEKRGTRR